MRHGRTRPDLVVGDDLENDEAVESPDQRKKLEKWFFKALMKIGQPDTVYIVVGTILHYDGLLNNLLKTSGSAPKWFEISIKLWDAVYDLFRYTSGRRGGKTGRALFNHIKEMLAGTEVLWPERESYYYLMKMRTSEGYAYFDSEKQNEPINPEDCLFQEAWFQFYDDEDVDLTGLPYAGVVDPSMGKKSKRHDPSAIMAGKYKDGRIYLTVADIEKRHPDKIIMDILISREGSFNSLAWRPYSFRNISDSLVKEAH